MSRTYSDPSYGSKKLFMFPIKVTMGTRPADTVVLDAGQMTAITPITITSWGLTCDATGNGATSTWILKKGTVALGTLSFATNPTAGGTVAGTCSGTDAICSVGDSIYLYAGLSTASTLGKVYATVEYVEHYLNSDN